MIGRKISIEYLLGGSERMNIKQSILTCVLAVIFAVTLFFVPWRVSDQLGGHYEFSAYWYPVPFDEGGVLRPVLLYVEWAVLAVGYVVLFLWLRTKKS